MSSSSNSYFSGVSNEIYGKVNAGTVNSATVNAGSVRTGTINCDSVQISLPKAAIITPTSATYTLTNADMSLLARGDVLFTDFSANCTFQLNSADSAAESLRLLDLFNITDLNTTRLIKLNRVRALRGFSVSIGAVSTVATTKYVQYLSEGAAGASNGLSQVFSGVAAHRDAYILVSSALAAGSSTEKQITFDVIGVGYA